MGSIFWQSNPNSLTIHRQYSTQPSIRSTTLSATFIPQPLQLASPLSGSLKTQTPPQGPFDTGFCEFWSATVLSCVAFCFWPISFEMSGVRLLHFHQGDKEKKPPRSADTWPMHLQVPR